MALFDVTLYYHTQASRTIQAETMEQAIDIARHQNIASELLNNLVEDNEPDVVELKSK